MKESKAIQKDMTIRNMIFRDIISIGVMYRLNTFIHQNGSEGSWGDFSFLKTALIATFCTGICYWLLAEDPFDEPIRNSTKLCVVSTATFGVLLFVALLLELGTDSFSLYGKKEIILWWFSIPKKYVYDVWIIIWFPLNINVIFKSMRKERFKTESVIYGCISVLGLTLEGILIFRPMANIWLVDLMVMNTATLILAIWKYVFSEEHVRKGNAIAAVILYAVMRLVLLPLQCNNWSEKFSTFIYGGDWSKLTSGINEIVANASFFGTSNYLQNSNYVHNWPSSAFILRRMGIGNHFTSAIYMFPCYTCKIIGCEEWKTA